MEQTQKRFHLLPEIAEGTRLPRAVGAEMILSGAPDVGDGAAMFCCFLFVSPIHFSLLLLLVLFLFFYAQIIPSWTEMFILSYIYIRNILVGGFFFCLLNVSYRTSQLRTPFTSHKKP